MMDSSRVTASVETVENGAPGAATRTATRADGEGAVVALNGAGKRFGELQAVQGVTMQVPVGGLVGLIGPSGCGKTTTVRLMLGVHKPDEGEVRVFGETPHRFRRRTRERIGYLPQQFVLYPTLTVDENLNFAASAYGIGPWRRRGTKSRVLDLVGLTAHRSSLASDISGGMQRRLSLAATLIHEPELIFLDEPTAGIDPILREQLWTEFRRLQQAGRTQIITTQYVGEAEYCDFVVLMSQGQIVAGGEPAALRRQVAGGELVDVTLSRVDDTSLRTLRAIPGVTQLQPRGENDIRLTTDQPAAVLIPLITEAMSTLDIQVQAIEERRLSFNEVFVALLARSGQNTNEVGTYGA